MKRKLEQLGICFALIAVSILTGCKQTDQDKVEKLVEDYAKANIADYKSFEIISLDSITEIYTDFMREQELQKHLQYHYYYNGLIDDENERIEKINKYISDCKNSIDNIDGVSRRRDKQFWTDAAFGLTNNYDVYNYADSQYELEREKKKINGYIGEAKAIKNQAKKNIECYRDSLNMVYNMTVDFCRNYEPLCLGKGTILKCRYRGDDGNMTIETFDLLLDNELTTLVSVTNVNDRPSNKTIESYVNFAISQVLE